MNLLEATATVNGARLDRSRRATARDQRRGGAATTHACASTGAGPVIVGLRAGDLHPAQGRTDLPQLHARGRARRGARRRVDGVLPCRRPHIKARPSKRKSSSRARRARPSSARGRTWSRRSRRTSSCKLGDEVPIAVDTKNLHFFDEATGHSASLARSAPRRPSRRWSCSALRTAARPPGRPQARR